MKQFTIPFTYRSGLLTAVKNKRKEADKLKKDFTPTLLDLGNLKIYLARHFGFCYGVENAIEIAFRTIAENPGKRIFLLSEMIHNPRVNKDLRDRGVEFLQDTSGNQLIPFEHLKNDDVVIIPAFGTTMDIMRRLEAAGISTKTYNTTCPFVEKVWNRGEQIGKKNYSIIVHGKPTHEETRATFSHASSNTPTLVIKDMVEAELLAEFIGGRRDREEFFQTFAGRYSEGFDPDKDLQRIGVINQTTMLAADTQGIADFLKKETAKRHGANEANITDFFADTRDTLCYATNDNQSAVYGLLETDADFAIVVGGYNSSNTSHLVELCEEQLPTYFIDGPERISDSGDITHFNLHTHAEKFTADFLPPQRPLRILMTSGASCPDAVVEAVIERLASLTGNTEQLTAEAHRRGE